MAKRTFNFLIIYILLIGTQSFGQVGIGTSTPSSKSILDLTSTSKGFLLPRMSTSLRTAMNPSSTVDKGMQVFDTDNNSIWYWNGTSWVQQSSGNIYNSNGDVAPISATNRTLTFTNGGSLNIDNNTLFVDATNNRVGIGTGVPDNSALLDLNSTTKGFKLPTMTWAQVQVIANPANGLKVFCTTYNSSLTNIGTPSVPNWVAETTAPINPADASAPAGTIRVVSGLKSNINTVSLDDISFYNQVVSGFHFPNVKTSTNRTLLVWASSEWSSSSGSEHSVGTYAVANGGQWTRNNYGISSTTTGISLHSGLSNAAADMLDNETNEFTVLDVSFKRFYKVVFFNYTVSGISEVAITVTKLK